MSPNRKEVLELLGQGKITAEEAAEMLSDNETAVPTPDPPKAEAAPIATPVKEEAVRAAPVGKTAVSPQAPTWFRVRVRNLETGQNRVSVNIPVGMLKFGMKIGKQFTSEMGDFDWKEINSMVDQMQTGMIVEVEDEDSNEHVQVYLE